MRNNQPVTQREYALAPGSAIISRTDSKGRIVACNDEFVEASGFTRDELIGQPHNLIRHPDMPPEAFRDMWATLKAGCPWTGMVKNRRKDGDHYWVRATATPLGNGDGYMSVRVVPSREEVTSAEALYARMRNGENIRLSGGEVVRGLGIFRFLFGPFHALWRNSVSFRVLLPALIPLLVLAVAGFIAVRGIHDNSVEGEGFQRIAASKDLLADVLPPPNYIIESYLTALEMSHRSDLSVDDGLARLRSLQADYDERHRVWAAYPLTEDLSRSLLKGAHTPAAAFFALAQGDYAGALRRGDAAAAARHLDELVRLYGEHRAAIDQVVAQTTAWNEQLVARSSGYARSFMMTTIAVIVGAAVLVLVIGLVSASSVSGPLRELRDALRKISGGDLLGRLPRASEDAIGEVVSAVGMMRNSLHELAASMRQGAGKVAVASQSLSSSASGASRSAVAQSDSATAMSSAVQQMSGSIESIAEHAERAGELATSAGETSREGSKVIVGVSKEVSEVAAAVNQTAGSVRELEGVSKEISTVVEVIREVSEQTNLLALNAAIEAARAGESGRGFAVVADEVRKLAERAGSSTVEISRMIEKIQSCTRSVVEEMESGVKRVQGSVVLAEKAGKTVGAIEAGATDVRVAVDGINSGLRSQSAAARDLASQVTAIADAARNNAGTARSIEQSAQEMEVLSKDLTSMTKTFRIA